MITTIIIYTLLAGCLIASWVMSREKTIKASKMALKVLVKTMPSLLAVLGLVGLTLGILSPQTISSLIGTEAGPLGTIIAAVLGAITLIPSLVAFPLAGSLLRAGASVMTISAFVTTLVMVGVVTAPMEIAYLGRRFTLLRNLLSFAAAFLIALLMGVIL
ncbi:MAG: permease [Spirochaetia bacterium]|nr:permease [Spirochaetia bacterium]